MDIVYGEQTATVETHAHSGAKPFVARITGTHPKYRMDRDFCAKQDVTMARTNTYRDLEFFVNLEEGALYQYRGMDASSSGGEDGFWKVDGGKLLPVSYGEALEIARELEVIRA